MPPNEFRLLAVDAAGIQKYIFNSNRLQENIGASHLVASITGQWAFDAVRMTANEVGGSHNLEADNSISYDVRIDDQPAAAVEVLYSGGGNFVALCRNEEVARVLTQTLSREVLEQAPGLHLMIHAVPFIWGQDSLREKLTQLFRAMKERRSTQPNVMPASGLAVTVMCGSTALPAVQKTNETNDEPRPASAEVLAKMAAANDANSRLARDLPPGDGYDYPRDLDDLGRTRGESSLVAVVHADGDGIGKRIEAIGNRFPQPSQVRHHIDELRRFSLKLEEAAKTALDGTLRQRDFAHLSLGKKDSKGRLYLPFRPLVFGGDDVTFVSDGRIGLALTLEYLRRFQDETERLLGERLTACAGVAIVKSHYPFARAYELAEELSRSAKKYRRESASDACCLDWHFTTGGIYGDLKAIRQREYAVKAGSLTLRPVTASGDGIRSWATIKAGLDSFQGDEWQEKRSKAKMLREKLRGGPESVKEFETLYGHDLPKVRSFTHGWSDDCCGYFDALELMDLYLPLSQEMINETHTSS